jgi:DDT domain
LLYSNPILHELTISSEVPYESAWIDGDELSDVLEVWDFCCIYKGALKLNKMPIEVFYASINATKRTKLVEDILCGITRCLLNEYDDKNDDEYIRFPVYIAIKSAHLVSSCWPGIAYLLLMSKKYHKTLLSSQVEQANTLRTLSNAVFYQLPLVEKLKVA